MSSVIERLKEATGKPSMMMSRDFDVRKLIAAYEARAELLAAIDDYYGTDFVRGLTTPEVKRILKARESADRAVRELEGT